MRKIAGELRIGHKKLAAGAESRPVCASTTTSGRSACVCKPITARHLTIIHPTGFTLVELLVVIACIAVLLAFLIPAMRAAREQAQRAVCLSNLRQLTFAWVQYADDHDGRLANGGANTRSGALRLESWVGSAFSGPRSRSDVMENPDKGTLWRYIRDVDIYRCPGAKIARANVTYSVVCSANSGAGIDGTCERQINPVDLTHPGKRVGNTVLHLTRLTDIISPGPSARAVFIDRGYQLMPIHFPVSYLEPKWLLAPPPIHHADGATLSMADGHAEYWKWKGRETVSGLPRELLVADSSGATHEYLGVRDYEPQTEDGLRDLQRVQRAVWGRLGYSGDPSRP